MNVNCQSLPILVRHRFYSLGMCLHVLLATQTFLLYQLITAIKRFGKQRVWEFISTSVHKRFKLSSNKISVRRLPQYLFVFCISILRFFGYIILDCSLQFELSVFFSKLIQDNLNMFWCSLFSFVWFCVQHIFIGKRRNTNIKV